MDRDQPYPGPELSRQAPVAEAGFNKGEGQFLSSGKNQKKKRRKEIKEGDVVTYYLSGLYAVTFL